MCVGADANARGESVCARTFKIDLFAKMTLIMDQDRVRDDCTAVAAVAATATRDDCDVCTLFMSSEMACGLCEWLPLLLGGCAAPTDAFLRPPPAKCEADRQRERAINCRLSCRWRRRNSVEVICIFGDAAAATTASIIHSGL